MIKAAKYFKSRLAHLNEVHAKSIAKEIEEKTNLSTKVITKDNLSVVVPVDDKAARRLEFSDERGAKVWRQMMARVRK